MSAASLHGETARRADAAKPPTRAASGKILLIASNFPPVVGGSAGVYANMARCADGRVIVLAPTLNYVDGRSLDGWREHDGAAPYRVVRRPLLRSRLLSRPPRALDRLFSLAADIRLRIAVTAAVVDLVIRHNVRTVCVGELIASSWLVALLRWAPWLRTVVYVHGEEITTRDGYDRGRRHARRGLRLADQIVVVSRFTEEAVLGLLGSAPGGKLRLIPNGVDTGRFRPHPPDAALRKAYGLDGCFVFVSVCRLLEKKGVDKAIGALSAVTRKHPDCRLLVVGSGPFEPSLRRLAWRNGVGDKVVFCGAVPDAELVDHYCLGDVFVMPNRALANGDTEGSGLVFLEANACGLPVIAGREGGSTDTVEHGVNGLIVDGSSVEEVAAAMLRMREDSSLRARIRDAGLARAAAADWSTRVEAFLKACSAPPSRGAALRPRPDRKLIRSRVLKNP